MNELEGKRRDRTITHPHGWDAPGKARFLDFQVRLGVVCTAIVRMVYLILIEGQMSGTVGRRNSGGSGIIEGLHHDSKTVENDPGRLYASLYAMIFLRRR